MQFFADEELLLEAFLAVAFLLEEVALLEVELFDVALLDVALLCDWLFVSLTLFTLFALCVLLVLCALFALLEELVFLFSITTKNLLVGIFSVCLFDKFILKKCVFAKNVGLFVV